MASSNSRARWARWLLIALAAAALVVVLAWIASLFVTGDAKAATRVKATASSYPASCLRIDPITGGTYNGCDGTQLTEVSSYSETATTSSTYGTCATKRHRKNYHLGNIGTVFWAELERHWCWRNGAITYLPATVTRSGVTTLGSSLFWDNDGLQNKYTYRDGNWSATSYAEWQFRCRPFGVTVCSRHPKISVAVNGNGGFSFSY
jgi:hypothetical protein